MISKLIPKWLLILPVTGFALLKFSFYPSIGLLILFLCSIAFFRDPSRTPAGKGMVSPADGLVKKISEKNGSTEISIFMRLRDVHINRIPLKGEVKKIKYFPGSFTPAFKDTSQNERNLVEVETDLGLIKLEQVAGAFARRIKCNLEEGDKVETGQRFGIIAFSSQVNITIPSGESSLEIEEGDKIKGGETLLIRRNFDTQK